MPGYPIGDWKDITPYAGDPWQGSLYNDNILGAVSLRDQMTAKQARLEAGGLNISTVNPSADPITAFAQAKQQAAAAVAAKDIKILPGGAAGSARPLIIDGSTLFGNAGIVAANLLANTDVLVNTYTVQVGYKVYFDDQDPTQQAQLRPYDNTTAAGFIDATCKVVIAEASTGDGKTIFYQNTIIFHPVQNYVSGDRFNKRWEFKWVADPGDLVQTFLRLPNGSPAVTVNPVVSRIAHRLKVWKIV